MKCPPSAEAARALPTAVTTSYASWPRGTLLASLSPACRAELLDLGARKRYAHGDVLIREGEDSTHAALLLRGSVKVTARLENGRLALLGVRVGGDLVGEMAALEGQPRCATVTACGDLVLRAIPRTALTTFLCRRPEAGLAVARMISQQLRWSNRRRTDFTGYPTRVRLARVLVELAKVYGHRTDEGIVLGVELTQSELGALAGADVDTAGKELRRLRSHEVIATGYRRTIIRDLTALEAFARLGRLGMDIGDWQEGR